MAGWLVKAHNAKNQVLGEFTQHAEQDYFFTRMLSDKYGTQPTIERLLLNGSIGPIARSAANQDNFSTSNVIPFEQQNYATLFLSGGNSSWRKHALFWHKQGFDKYIGGVTIEKHFGEASDDPRGVYNLYLFQYLQK